MRELHVLIWNHWIQRHSNRGSASTHEKITGARPGPRVTQNVKIDIGSPRLSLSGHQREGYEKKREHTVLEDISPTLFLLRLLLLYIPINPGTTFQLGS